MYCHFPLLKTIRVSKKNNRSRNVALYAMHILYSSNESFTIKDKAIKYFYNWLFTLWHWHWHWCWPQAFGMRFRKLHGLVVKHLSNSWQETEVWFRMWFILWKLSLFFWNSIIKPICMKHLNFTQKLFQLRLSSHFFHYQE